MVTSNIPSRSNLQLNIFCLAALTKIHTLKCLLVCVDLTDGRVHVGSKVKSGASSTSEVTYYRFSTLVWILDNTGAGNETYQTISCHMAQDHKKDL